MYVPARERRVHGGLAAGDFHVSFRIERGRARPAIDEPVHRQPAALRYARPLRQRHVDRGRRSAALQRRFELTRRPPFHVGRRNAIVGHVGNQGDRRAGLRMRYGRNRYRRRPIAFDQHVAHGGTATVVRYLDFPIDLPDVEQGRARLLRPAIRRERSHQFFPAIPVSRNVHLEQEVILTRIEVLRLAAILAGR